MFINYYDYIQSSDWQQKRKKYYSSDLKKQFNLKNSWKCVCCLSDNVSLELHHRTYKRLGNEHLKDLVCVCRSCHQLIHDHYKNDKSSRKSLWKSTNVIKKMKRKF